MSARPGRRARRAAVAVALGLSAAVMAAGVTGAGAAPADDKAKVDEKLERARDRLAGARGREAVLTDEVGALTARVRVLEQKLAPLRAEAERLEAEAAALRSRLDALTARLRQERERLQEAMQVLAVRREALGSRLRQLYVRGTPDPVLVLLDSGSLSDAVATADTLDAIVRRDRDLAASVKEYADKVRATKRRIEAVRDEVAEAEARAERAADRANEAKAGLETQAAEVSGARDRRAALLSRVKGDREHIEEETRGLERQSERLAAKIRKAQGVSSSSGSAPTGTVNRSASAQGFIWPVSGTLTSNYGWRWGRMHQGIDVAAGTGTPIAAAAAGTVIVAGWNGGYGNLVVVDHGNGISTAYAHQSAMSVSVGQSVGQGTILGAVGSTGNSTGPHLHFEVRINGAATDPLPYL